MASGFRAPSRSSGSPTGPARTRSRIQGSDSRKRCRICTGQELVVIFEAAAALVLAPLDRMIAARADPVPVLREWLAAAWQQLECSGVERGCPLATVALETTAEDTALRAALGGHAFGLLPNHDRVERFQTVAPSDRRRARCGTRRSGASARRGRTA